MSILVVRFPQFDVTSLARVARCPHCDSSIIQSWGQISKTVRDSVAQEITINRYRCCRCGRTFRGYPAGIDRASLSLRMHNLAALAFALGLSVRQVTEAFEGLGLKLSRMTVYRDGMDMAVRLDPSGRRKYEQIFLMEKNVPQKERLRGGVRLILDMGQGKFIVLGILDEYNPRTVQTWLEPVCRQMGAEVYMADTGRLQQNLA